VFVFLAAAPLTWAYSLVRSVRRLSALKSRVVETAWPLRGPVVMLEDGLVISLLGGRLVLLSLLFRPDGSVLRVPVQEALRWMTVLRTRRVATAIPGSIPSPAGPELEALRMRLGVRISFVVVREPRHQPASPANPRWIATLTASITLSAPNVGRLSEEIDSIEDFLKRLVARYAHPTLSVAVDKGRGEPTPPHTRPAEVTVPGERLVGVGLWRRFRGTYPGFQRMVALTLVLAATTALSGFFLPGFFGLAVFLVLIPGGALIGASARTRRDGFAGGLIFGWAGTFLGILIVIPLEAGLQGGGLSMVGVGLLAGFAGGLALGFIEGLFGGVAGYVGARLAKKPIRAQ
jgi:hypothetical protein